MPRTMQIKAPIYSRMLKSFKPKKEFKCDKRARAHVGIVFESCVTWLHSGEHILVVFGLRKIVTLIIFFILNIRKKKFQEKMLF